MYCVMWLAEGRKEEFFDTREEARNYIRDNKLQHEDTLLYYCKYMEI